MWESEYAYRKWTQAIWFTGVVQGGAVAFNLWQRDWQMAAVMAVNCGCWAFLVWAWRAVQKRRA